MSAGSHASCTEWGPADGMLLMNSQEQLQKQLISRAKEGRGPGEECIPKILQSLN